MRRGQNHWTHHKHKYRNLFWPVQNLNVCQFCDTRGWIFFCSSFTENLHLYKEPVNSVTAWHHDSTHSSKVATSLLLCLLYLCTCIWKEFSTELGKGTDFHKRSLKSNRRHKRKLFAHFAIPPSSLTLVYHKFWCPFAPWWNNVPCPSLFFYLSHTKQDCVHLQHKEAVVPKQNSSSVNSEWVSCQPNTSSDIYNPNNIVDYRNPVWAAP